MEIYEGKFKVTKTNRPTKDYPIPGAQDGGAATALLALILCAYLMSSSEEIRLFWAWFIDCSFCLAWKIAVACNTTYIYKYLVSITMDYQAGHTNSQI